MIESFYEMIFKRKSFHIFRNVGKESISNDEIDEIQKTYSELTPLHPGIKTAIRIVPEEQTNCRRGGEYCILLFSEKKDGYLQNIGYLGEQRGIMPADMVSFYNRIDIGIFICFMDICLEHGGIGFEKKLFSDDGEEKEFVLNAEYRLDR